MIALADLATAEDFLGFYGQEAPPVWLGLKHRIGGRVVAIGGAIWDEHGYAIGFIDRRAPLSAFTLFRNARRVMAALKHAGEPALYAGCDPSVWGAREFLERLGFEPMAHDPGTWKVDLA